MIGIEQYVTEKFGFAMLPNQEPKLHPLFVQSVKDSIKPNDPMTAYKFFDKWGTH